MEKVTPCAVSETRNPFCSVSLFIQGEHLVVGVEQGAERRLELGLLYAQILDFVFQLDQPVFCISEDQRR